MLQSLHSSCPPEAHLISLFAAPLVAEGWDAVPAPPVVAIPEAGIPTPQPTGWE